MANIRETIQKKSEISLVFKTGKKHVKPPLVVFFRKNGLEHSRFLFCADRSHQKAVQRNRTKRVLRAVLSPLDVPIGLDIAFVAGKKYSELDFTRRVDLMLSLLNRMRG